MGYRSIEIPSPVAIPERKSRRVINQAIGSIPTYIVYMIYTDGSATWRKGCRDGLFVLDKTLTMLGFSGTENIDWENVRQLE